MSDTQATAPDTTTRTIRVHQIYIKATPQAIWDAITKTEWLERYAYGCPTEFELRPGGVYRSSASAEMQKMGVDGVVVDGEVIEVDPPRKLVQTWHFRMDPEADAEGPTRLTYEIEPDYGDVTKVTVTHDVTGAPRVALMIAGEIGGGEEGGGGGWEWILSDLKSVLETGSSMFV